jgi:hypothetical protein
VAETSDAEDIHYYYYLLLAGFNPFKCVRLYENRQTENFWQAYWTSLAYLCLNDQDKAQDTLNTLDKWTNKKEEYKKYKNLLEGVLALYEFSQTEQLDSANRAYSITSKLNFYSSDKLQNFCDCVKDLSRQCRFIDESPTSQDIGFYWDYIIGEITSGLFNKD